MWIIRKNSNNEYSIHYENGAKDVFIDDKPSYWREGFDFNKLIEYLNFKFDNEFYDKTLLDNNFLELFDWLYQKEFYFNYEDSSWKQKDFKFRFKTYHYTKTEEWDIKWDEVFIDSESIQNLKDNNVDMNENIYCCLVNERENLEYYVWDFSFKSLKSITGWFFSWWKFFSFVIKWELVFNIDEFIHHLWYSIFSPVIKWENLDFIN